MYGVITRVAEPKSGGNLAFGESWLDPQAKGGSFEDGYEPLASALGNPKLALYIRTPVFRVGELLILNENDRDQFTRKPGKWDVTCEEFESIEDACKRVLEVTKQDD